MPLRRALYTRPKTPPRELLDSTKIDFSLEHRERARAQLYGAGRVYYGAGKEAGSYDAPYADEVPPPWASTMRSDFSSKPLDGGLSSKMNHETSTYSKKSHFSLDHDSEHYKPESTMKGDYQPKFVGEGDRKSCASLMLEYQVRGSQSKTLKLQKLNLGSIVAEIPDISGSGDGFHDKRILL